MPRLQNRPALPDRIKTARLLLRAPVLADAAALQNLANNKNVFEMLARLPHPYTNGHALDFITNLARTRNEHAYAIVTKNGDFVGVAGLHLKNAAIPELGYWLGEPYWGQGYASEAANAVVQAAFERGFDKIGARSMAVNARSIRVLQKCGFVKTDQRVDDCGHHLGVSVVFFERVGPKPASNSAPVSSAIII